MARGARWVPLAVTGAVAAVLTGTVVVAADSASCDEPGRYVRSDTGVSLVGGCLDRGDLPVGPATDPLPADGPAVPLGAPPAARRG